MGDLSSTEVDHCTLHFTWTAPYTLQGVPILNYTITVKGTVEEQYMSSNTEFLYSPSDLSEVFEIVVAAVNAVGLGVESDIMVDPPSTGEFCKLSCLKTVLFHSGCCYHSLSLINP